MRHRNVGKAGFSLVELSIVLVILGLLVGGVLGGRSLVRAAELRSVGEEYSQIETAVITFKGKYGQLPGDITIATRLWSDTANGNGDAIYDYPDGPNQFGESFTFWQHLALAGLIPGQYTGMARGGSQEDALIGVNVMGSRFTGAGWGAYTIQDADLATMSSVGWYQRHYGNIFQIGGKFEDWEYGAPIFTPEDAHYIDSKFDEGTPSKGNIVGRYWDDECGTAITGAVTSTNLETRYRLTDTTAQCAIAFVPIFR